MPVHDWTRVAPGIFHDFHLEWISRIKHALNDGLLPPDYYALAEQHTGGLEPDVLTLRGLEQEPDPRDWRAEDRPDEPEGGLKLARPRLTYSAEVEVASYRRKQRSVVVRHVSGDDVVAMVEIVSPGNKDSRRALEQFVGKAAWLLERGIHQLIFDLFPPTPRDPRGMHSAIWEELGGEPFEAPPGKPLILAAYEQDGWPRAYVEPVGVGQSLPDMPLFLRPGGYVDLPTERTYAEAFAAVPRRWRAVLEGDAA